jgi:putative secretion ATPase (PEP-CTERM system associated)
MYESHFGFSGPPFQLNPDPSFLFESSNHGRALSYLRYGVQQGEGFIVITGDIGAGKTTLVRALMEQLDADQVVAAHLANTQLESAELLHCILTAFGVPAQGLGKGGMIANLEAFLTGVAASGRRALLVVDEAQNLGVQVLEELRMLSNFQLGSHALLQSFLVGQPELRQLLQGPSMEQLRQRILASYHLGPLSGDETAGYVKHRLQHVGWRGDPPFDEFALAAIHERTGGVPRRINLLCNRVLLATYLSGSEGITHELVHQTADELSGELHLPMASRTVAAESPKAPGATSVSAPAAPLAAPPTPVHPTLPAAPTVTVHPPAPAVAALATADVAVAPSPATVASGAVVPADATPFAETPHSPLDVSALPSLEAVSLDLDCALPDAADVLSAAGAGAELLEFPKDATVQVSLPPPSEKRLEEPVAEPSVEPVEQSVEPPVRQPVQPLMGERPVLEAVWPATPAAPAVAPVPRTAARHGRPAVLALADDALGLAKLHRIALRWRQERPRMEFWCAHVGNDESLAGERATPWLLNGAIEPELVLGNVGPNEVATALTPWLNAAHTQALVVIGHSWALLHAMLAARQAGIPVLRLEAGALRGDLESDLTLVNALMDRASQWLCCAGLPEQQALAAEGLSGHRVSRIGPLVSGVLQSVAEAVPDARRVLADFVLSPAWLARAATGFGLITAQFRPDDVPQEDALQWLMLARLGHSELPMLWLASPETLAALRDPSLRLQIESSGIAVVADPGPLARVGLLGAARCVMCSSAKTLVEESLAMGVPVVHIALYAYSPSLLEGPGITQVGPSAVKLRAAVRAAQQRRGFAGQLEDLDDDAAIEAAQQLARWLTRRADGAAAFEEAVA